MFADSAGWHVPVSDALGVVGADVGEIANVPSLAGLCLDQTIDAVLVIDAFRRVRYANSKALSYQEARFLISKDAAGRLVFIETAAMAEYQRALAAIYNDRSQRVGFEICASCRPSVQISIQTAGERAEPDLSLIIIRNLDEANALRAQRATQQFALTPSESRVLQAALSGLSPTECAQSTGLKITTVRTQLAALFAKTGTSRQAELIVKIMQQPLF